MFRLFTIKFLTAISMIFAQFAGFPIATDTANYSLSGGVTVGSGAGSVNAQIIYARNRHVANPFNYGISKGVIVEFGQSNFSNVNPTNYIPTNPVFSLSLIDGYIYQDDTSPTLNTSTGFPLGTGCTAERIADSLISQGSFTSIVHMDSAIGGTNISPVWANDSYNVISVTFKRLRQAGLTPNAVLFGQGEGDTQAGTSQAAYAAGLASFISNVRNAGYSGPIFIAHQSWNSGVTSANVTNAQDAAVNHGANIWAGPNADSLGAGSRQADNTHFTDAGAASYTTLWIAALHASGISPFLYQPPFAANDNWQALEGCNDNTSDLCKAM